MKFKTLNNIIGWAIFAIALVTYLLTIEPTASLWDCGEFIATSYKLEVGHPPGTPFFFLINRLGAMFASSPSQVAAAINSLSAIESAFTILFLFWSISHLGRRIYAKKADEISTEQSWAVLGAAAVGALAYTFSDSFWFSAVEAEVYAMSSMFTAMVFWAMLKWEDVADEPGSNRWLILIAYLMGLSIGAHILNLLTIPALVFIYYFKKFPDHTNKELWKPASLSVIILGGFYMLTPTVISIGAFFDRIFVNSLSMPVNSGLTFFIVILLAALGYGIWRTHKAQRALLNAIMLSAAMVVIGFSTYGIVLIRATANPPMNSNAPADPYSLERFINREQYGSRPLIWGKNFASTPTGGYDLTKSYILDEKGKYKAEESVLDREYDPATTSFFPRMYSDNPAHIRDYKSWSNFTGKEIITSKGQKVTVPTAADNLSFFFGYQVNNMYWRYLLWNFVGRQSDLQYDGITNGNWLSGINVVDELYLGPQDNLPTEIAQNRGRNTYFFLPFILGLIGLFFHLRRDGRNFWVVMTLFLMTGLAIILYLNQTPLQPRERDYAYVASFYAFAIWIGIGLLPVYELIKRKVNGRAAAVSAIVLCSAVPLILVVQNWDDHDRSGRYIQRDMGRNYLSACLPQSVLINHGDNDTFSVWYTQEVEGFRTDVRPLNSSYISGGWYVDQMRVKANDSEPLPLTISRSKYNAAFPIVTIPHPDGGMWTIKDVMEFVNSDHPATKIRGYDYIPDSIIAVPVNKANVIKSGVVKAENADMIEDTIYIRLDPKRELRIAEMVVLDLIAHNDWKRAIYTTGAQYWLDFGIIVANKDERYSYLQECGTVSLLVPFKTPLGPRNEIGYIDTEQLYGHLMKDANYGNISDPHTYVCSFTENTLLNVSYRGKFSRLSRALSDQGDTIRAVAVLDRIMKELPTSQLRFEDKVIDIIQAYWIAGANDKGDALAMAYIKNAMEYIEYYERFTGKQAEAVEGQTIDQLQSLYMLSEYARHHDRSKVSVLMKGLF